MFGKTTIGADYWQVPGDADHYMDPPEDTQKNLLCALHNNPNDHEVVEVLVAHIRGGQWANSRPYVRGCIYDEAGNLLAVTEEKIIEGMADWTWVPFRIVDVNGNPASVILNAGNYYLCLQVGCHAEGCGVGDPGYGVIQWSLDSSGLVSAGQIRDLYADGPSDPLAITELYDHWRLFDIYASTLVTEPYPPTADFTFSTPPIANEPVYFDGSISKEGWDGVNATPIVEYAWDFGDGTGGTGELVSHAYATVGPKTVTLTVTDSIGQTGSKSLTVTILETPPANLIYSTKFGNAIIGYGDWHLDGVDPLSTYISMGDGRGRQWIEGLDEVTTDPIMEGGKPFQQMPGSTRCIGGEQINAAAERSEFAIYPAGGGGDNTESIIVGDEFFIRFWRLLPIDWALNSPTNRWTILLQVSDIIPPAMCPFWALFYFENPSPDFPDIQPGEKWAVLGGRDENAQPIPPLAIYKGFENVLPLGRWFKIEWYMLRHRTNGIIKCWVDNKLIFDVKGVKTKSVDEYEVGIGKIYYDPSDDTRHRSWVDNLEIWNALPEDKQAPPTPPEALVFSIPVPILTGLGLLWIGMTS